MSLLNPTQFSGRFEGWHLLGGGGEGKLYRVQDNWTGKLAVLKVVSDKESRERLIREYALISKLRHPCLIAAHDLVWDGSEVALLLEYIPAIEPYQLWSLGGEDGVWAAIVQALRGITYLHRQGYLHRDISPGNILIWESGEGWRAKVADLGLVTRQGQSSVEGVTGTLGYMAPEAFRPERLTAAADYYSLAATAVAWIDGSGPWDGLNPGDVLRALSSSPSVPMPKRQVSPELETLLDVLGKASPDERSHPEWSDLRRVGSWGPPILEPTIRGVEKETKCIRKWIDELPTNGVGTCFISGRSGTGRTTLAQAVCRSVSLEGWSVLWGMPLDIMRDLMTEKAGVDPVQLAMKLAFRFGQRNVVITWPDRIDRTEARLLRSLVASRGGSRTAGKTVILRVANSIEQNGDDGDVAWLIQSTRTNRVEWGGISQHAINDLVEDLFPPEEGVTLDSTINIRTPQDAVRAKRTYSNEVMPNDEGGQEEVACVLRCLSSPGRSFLGVLAYCDFGWRVVDIKKLGLRDKDLQAIEESRLLQTTYDLSGQSVLEFADWTTKELVRREAPRILEATALKELVKWIENYEIHPGDIGLTRGLLENGIQSIDYLRGAVEAGLQSGRFEGVLALRQLVTKSFGPADVSHDIWDAFLAAAQMARSLEEEVEILDIILSQRGLSTTELVRYKRVYSEVSNGLGRYQESLSACREIEQIGSQSDKVWAMLQAAETLWLSGRFDEARDAYEKVESQIPQEMKFEWLRYAVGRARQSGQQGDMGGVEGFLALARERAGVDVCNQNALYLHTLGGLQIELADYPKADETMKRAVQVASDENDWRNYVMIAARAGGVAYSIGKIWDAARLARRGVSASEAIGSARMIAMTSTFAGFAETQLADFGSAIRRALQVLHRATAIGDLNMTVQCHRLLAFTAANACLADLLLESVSSLQETAKKIGERESVAFGHLCRGLFYHNIENWEAASEELETAISQMRSLRQLGSDLRASLLLNLTEVRMGKGKDSLPALVNLRSEIVGRYPQLSPLVMLGIIECRRMQSSWRPDDDPEPLLDLLWREGRFVDLLDWGPRMLGLLAPDRRTAVKKRLLAAIQRAAASFDEPRQRQEFLSSPRIRGALLAIS